MVGCARYCGRAKKLYVTYKCPSPKHNCNNREINSGYLEKYVVGLLEKEIFNANALKAISKEIKKEQKVNIAVTKSKHNSAKSKVFGTKSKVKTRGWNKK